MSKSKLPKVVSIVKESKLEKDSSKVNVSYSQLSQYLNCKHQWYLSYVKKLSKYTPSIHTVFGTAIHNTIQSWLTQAYDVSVKSANNMNLEEILKQNLIATYKSEKSKATQHFTTKEEMDEIYLDGVEILSYLKKKRSTYFGTRKVYLAGVETMLNVDLAPGVAFNGFIDLVFYDEDLDKWLLLDIKTSTSGWNNYAKKDEIKVSQLILYKKYFSKQFNISEDKIEVEYFILKRKVPENPEYPTMARRVQQFRPASGRVKQGVVQSYIDSYLNECIGPNGKLIDKQYEKQLILKACRFCEYRNTEHCKESVNVN